MGKITDWLSGLSGGAVLAVVGLLVFAEDAIFVGFVLPGETAAVLGGVIASRGHVSLPLVLLVVVGAAILGDSVGYEIGRHFGPRILQVGLLRKHALKIDNARAMIRRRGPAAVFLGRFIAFFRAMMPALAGISRMPYPVFLVFNALGGLVWGVGFVLLGYLAGNSYAQVEKTAGRWIAVVVAVLVVIGIIVWRVRKHRRYASEEAAYEVASERDER
jgi:membrane-associated protein